jgi:hypothetical protein
MKLRIVSWNCNMALYQKFDRLIALRPDVAVIQECASPERDAARGWMPPCSDRDWIGFNADKGLGIFTFGGLKLRRHKGFSDAFALALPVEVWGRCRLNLLGLWRADGRRIPAGATNDPLAALCYYRRFISTPWSVVAGDFNLLPQQMSLRPGQRGQLSIVELLARAGLRNADTLPTADTVGDPLRRTHYHQRKPGRGFVVDYLFAPRREAARLTRFEVGDPREWLPWSDHVPLVAEFTLTANSAFTNWFGRAHGSARAGIAPAAPRRVIKA